MSGLVTRRQPNRVLAPTMDDPPTSPHAYDDEFEGPTLDPKWTIHSVNPIDTVNPVQLNAIAAGKTRMSFDYRPGWLMVQPVVNDQVNFDQPVTLSTNCTVFARMSFYQRFSGVTNNDTSFGIALVADSGGSPDELNFVAMKLNESDGNTVQGEGSRTLAGVAAQSVSRNVGPQSLGLDSLIQNACYVLLHKTGTTYNFGLGQPDGNWMWLTPQTHASSMVWLRFLFHNVNTAAPGSLIMGIKFIRYYDGLYLP